MSGEERRHVRWEEGREWHQGEEYGCVWRHAPGWGKTPCHYAMNSYAAAVGRVGLYNRAHREVAKALGYAVEEEGRLRATGRIGEVVGEEARKRPEE